MRAADPIGRIGVARCAARELLGLAARPTAIFALADKLAFGVLRAAYELGIDVPGQLSAVGFDDIEAASLVSPALTTVGQPLDVIGTTAAQMLLNTMAAAENGPVMHVQLPTTLIVRETIRSPI